MKEFEKKSDLFLKELETAQVGDMFEKITNNDEAVIFRSFQNMSNGTCVVLAVFDETVYLPVSYLVATLENVGKKEKILNLLNDLNQNYKTLKFYINDKNQIVAEFTYISLSDDFNAAILLSSIINSFKDIEQNDYPKIMRVIWS